MAIQLTVEMTVESTVAFVIIKYFYMNIQVMSSHKKSENVRNFTNPYAIKCQI